MPSSDTSQRRKSGVKGCFLIFCVIALVLILTPILVFVVWSASSSRRVSKQLAEIRAKGEPVNAAELDAYYTLPNGKDADTTALLLEALARLSSPEFSGDARGIPIVGDGEKTIPPLSQPWSDQKAVEELLEKYRESMQDLHEVADQGAAARFDLKFEDGFGMLLEHDQNMRSAIRMLQLETHVRARQGDAAGVVDSIQTGFRLGNAINQEPTLVSQLVNIAIRSAMLRMIIEYVPQMDFTDEQLAELQGNIRQVDYAELIKQGLIGERAIAIEAFRDPSSMGATNTPPRMPLGPRNDDLSLYLELITPIIDAADESFLEQRKAADQSMTLFQTRTANSFTRLRYIMTALVFPALDATVDASARAAAERDLVDCLLAVQRFRLANGKPPKALEELTPKFLPQVPLDPFDGQPLRYRVTASEVVLYSIGKNQTDDGGVGDKTMEPDIVVRLPLKPKDVNR